MIAKKFGHWELGMGFFPFAPQLSQLPLQWEMILGTGE